MQLMKNLFFLGALAAPVLAQDDSECDPQNDNNNDATCMSGTMAMTSDAANITTTQTSTAVSTDSNGRVSSYVVTSTAVGPELVFTSNVLSSVVVTTNPQSIYTTTYSDQETYTLVNTEVSTGVYTSTASDGSVTTGTNSPNAGAGAAGTGNGNDDNDDNDDSDSDDSDSSSTGTASEGIAAPTQMASLISGAGLAGVLGLVAAL